MEPGTEATVHVRLFARARELAGADTLDLTVPGAAKVGDVRRLIGELHPALRGLLARSALAVNGEFADDSQPVPPGAEVALLPPVSGG